MFSRNPDAMDANDLSSLKKCVTDKLRIKLFAESGADAIPSAAIAPVMTHPPSIVPAPAPAPSIIPTAPKNIQSVPAPTKTYANPSLN